MSQGNETGSDLAPGDAPAGESQVAPGFPALPEMQAGWSFLPQGRPFGILPSDPRDIHLGLFKNNKSELEADLGGYRSVVGWRGEVDGRPFSFQAGIEGAAYFQMVQQGSKFPLDSSDGLLGIYGEASSGPWAYQLRYTHISAHLVDGLFGVQNPFIYTREFIEARASRRIDWIRPYVGYEFLTHSAPVLPKSSLEIGTYGIPDLHWGTLHPYFGADLRVRNAQEGTTFQLGTGAAFVSAHGAPPLLITASYLKGHDLRGQFYNQPTEKWLFGLDLEI